MNGRESKELDKTARNSLLACLLKNARNEYKYELSCNCTNTKKFRHNYLVAILLLSCARDLPRFPVLMHASIVTITPRELVVTRLFCID